MSIYICFIILCYYSLIEYVNQRCESVGFKFHQSTWITFLYITLACFNSGTENLRQCINYILLFMLIS